MLDTGQGYISSEGMIYAFYEYFVSCHWWSRLPGRCTLDLLLSPPLTPVEILGTHVKRGENEKGSELPENYAPLSEIEDFLLDLECKQF